MSETLLRTKLYVPPRQLNLVPRPDLMKRLRQGIQFGHKLTLISAPAGFGKTTLVSEWLAGCERPAAWLSLDEGENDPTRFLAYLIAAVQTILPDIGESTLGMLQSPQPPATESVLTTLLNEIAATSAGSAQAAPDPFLLVLDDYHVIDAQAVDDALAFLLEHMPPHMHLVIATREDLKLPLAGMRGRGQLTELRAADLRFTFAEIAEFLNHIMGLELSTKDIAALETRTEGWITGLQLAAISMRGREDVAAFIQSFTGSHHFVLDYLVEEVLEQQPERVQDFLLQTSIVSRMTASLCDAITGQKSGQTTLEMLGHANLFIIPLDDERHWYRYHHLFADLLHQRLRRSNEKMIATLHLRASAWYEQNDQLPEAIHHALAAEDFEKVADLAELAWHPMNMRYQAVTWLGWVQALPEELIRTRPLLSAGCGWASLDAGDLEAAEKYLLDAERWLDTTTNGKGQKVELDEEEVRELCASIANGRAYFAQALGDVTGTVQYAQQATDFLREDDYFERGLAEVLPGFAYWASGDLELAQEAVMVAIVSMQKTGKTRFVISFTSYLADIMVAQGRLEETKQTYLQLLESVTKQGGREIPETAVLHLGLSEIFLEQGDLKVARHHLKKSEAFGEQHWFAPWYRHWICAHAHMLMIDSELDSVLTLLNGAEQLYYRHPIPDIHPLKAQIARTWLTQGQLIEAERCVQQQTNSVADDLSYLHEYEHITLARLLIAQYRSGAVQGTIHDAMVLLERLLQTAEAGRRMGSLIEILVLQTLAYAAQEDLPAALISLEHALKLAEPQGYCRVFVDEGKAMRCVLHAALSRGIRPDYVQRLLAAFPVEAAAQSTSVPELTSGSEWVEPLSEREIEVLHLIAEGYTNPEIASRLFLSLNTVKVHTRNIYGKLDAHTRTQAVARARDLRILPV